MSDRDSISAPSEKLDNTFREITGFPGYYLRQDGTAWTSWRNIRNQLGQIECVMSGELRQIVVSKNRQGYSILRISRERSLGQIQTMLSRAMLLAFIGEPPTPRHCACHCDGNKDNNAITNLRWDTRAGNEADKILHGTTNRGARNGMAKLTASKVEEIRRLYKAVPLVGRKRPNGTLQAIADQVGLPPRTVKSAAYYGWIDVGGGPIRTGG